MGSGDVNEDTDSVSLAVLATKLDGLVTTVGKIETRLETSATVHVTRSEWELRNQTVDERFVGVRAELAATQADMKARRAPWWAIVGAVAGSAAILAYVIDVIPRIVN